MKLRIVTYNLRKGKGIRGSRPAFDEIASALRDLSPDLLLCQEVFHARGKDGQDQSAILSAISELFHRYEPNARYRRGHHGNTTLAKAPILVHENQDISTNRIERRGVLYTLVAPAPGQRLHVFNTHFGLSQRQRLRQAVAVGAMIRDRADPGEPVLLAGDFNDWNGRIDPRISEEGRLDNAMLALAMKDRRTYSTRRPLFSLDRIYYRGLHLVEVRVLRDRPFARMSDHFPVEATFELRDQTS